MFHQLMLKGIFLIKFFDVISANPIELCNNNCDSDDNTQVCVLDKSSICFIKFSSKCLMKNIQCVFEKEFTIYDAEFCELEGFQCSDKSWPKFQSPPLEEDQTISYNENFQEGIEIVLKHDGDSKNEDNINNQDNEVTSYAKNAANYKINTENNVNNQV